MRGGVLEPSLAKFHFLKGQWRRIYGQKSQEIWKFIANTYWMFIMPSVLFWSFTLLPHLILRALYAAEKTPTAHP